jgi:hypothetical protein
MYYGSSTLDGDSTQSQRTRHRFYITRNKVLKLRVVHVNLYNQINGLFSATKYSMSSIY